MIDVLNQIGVIIQLTCIPIMPIANNQAARGCEIQAPCALTRSDWSFSIQFRLLMIYNYMKQPIYKIISNHRFYQLITKAK